MSNYLTTEIGGLTFRLYDFKSNIDDNKEDFDLNYNDKIDNDISDIKVVLADGFYDLTPVVCGSKSLLASATLTVKHIQVTDASEISILIVLFAIEVINILFDCLFAFYDIVTDEIVADIGKAVVLTYWVSFSWWEQNYEGIDHQ